MTASENLSISEYIRKETKRTLESYRIQPNHVEEHANIEREVALGGYAGRQLYELVQNSADTLSKAGEGEIWIRLTEAHLYCADNGEAIDIDGVKALMFSYMSPKRNTDEIGRFGMGFKSVLGVTDAPEFFSRSGSFRFDRDKSAERIRKAIGPDAADYPVLRLPEVIDPAKYESEDQILREMMGWATNIVRLSLRDSKAYADLAKQIEDFPEEFLLFVEHVKQIRLQMENQGDVQTRVITLSENEGSRRVLKDERSGASTNKTSWTLHSKVHSLSSDAKSDIGISDDTGKVQVQWAVPVDNSDDTGKFWAFFPTVTSSLLSGILNAPWKTNETGTDLLEGAYNTELIDAAADMVADALPSLSKTDDPASHLDALPPGQGAGDTVFANYLRNHLYANLRDREFVPDQDGKLRRLSDISYPPQGMNPDALGRWAEYEGRPKDWLHHGALTQNRFAKLNEIYKHENQHNELQRKSIRQWLESLRDTLNTEQPRWPIGQKVNPVNASRAAIRTAAEISRYRKFKHYRASMPNRPNRSYRPYRPLTPKELGNIVYTSDGEWQTPDPDKVRLSGDSMYNAGVFVHPDLEWDKKTLASLKTLRLKPVTLETDFRDLAVSISRQREWNEGWTNLYELARKIGTSRAVDIVRSIKSWSLRVRTVSGTWEPLQDTLLPGPIVSSDGSRDGTVAIDTAGFHKQDVNLLRMLGAIEKPYGGEKFNDRESPIRPYMYAGATSFGRSNIANISRTFAEYWKSEFRFRANLDHTPKEELLEIDESTTSGPVYMFEKLSEEGAVLYTWELLDLDDTYNSWIARHTGKNGYGCRTYPPMEFSPARIWLRKCGRIKTDDGEIHPFEDVFGDPPRNKAAHAKLLSHPRGASIRRAFDI